jgi:3-oxoacyl-[acyl-carrier protein] reductase
MGLLQDRIAVVTGATGVLGRCTSVAMADAGAHIVVHYNRREREALELVRQIERMGRCAIAVGAELTRGDEADRLIESAEKHFGRIDILVNNAGITRDCLILEMTQDDWDAVLSLNLGGAFRCLRAAAAPMMLRRSGSIINISSVTSYSGWPGQCNYAASKAGLDALTRCAATELARFNVRINSVAPGMLRSEMSEEAMKIVGERLLKLIPMRRLGVPEEVVSTIVFLASDQASYITGEVVSVKGGLGMGLPDSVGVRAYGKTN